ncbi:branched-chain amino acid ABC transporter permease [Streptomyces sp. ISID311]|uniref:branched-chain amino acid ABC transporter permease n=1 Tax=Streptomyces sp. ISID311 TaxID=2601673 RepID=UPI0011BD3327|nr:branched-chain amino acid ABC transporter permease [Streptomyces sp. ISID311]TXC99842.1 branched-chain amino acid ABC transporter permease [Streptomyces sp. ISID311]
MTTAAASTWSIQRAGLASRIGSSALILVALALFAVPQILNANIVQQLTSLLIFLILAVMWNALAGYAGLVSVGQQSFIGFGAYGTILLTQHGVQPYFAVVLAAAASAVLAAVLSLLVLRLRGGQFAVGTWVVAEAIALFVMLDKGLGGGTGMSLHGLSSYAPQVRRAFTYWLTLGFAVLLLVLLFLLLRHRTGAALQAIRDDEDAAASLGVRVRPLKFMLFVLAGFGCGAAGALTLANTLFIQPQSIFGVQWSAYMIFMVLVGGIGTFEGPIIGAILFFAVQYFFADQGAWYLIGLGLTAVAFALFAPRGLWSLLSDRLHVQLLAVGYHLRRQEPRPHASSRET